MTRPLSVHVPLAGDARVLAGRLAGDPETWLPAPARRRGMDHWSVDLAAGPLHRRVACRVGAVWMVRDGVWRTLTWGPAAQRQDPVAVDHALPTFRGELGVTTTGDGEATVVLAGVYQPPVGVLGAAADAVLLHKVAETTAEWFVREVVRALRVESAPARHAG